jgi:hypothetical protein
LRDDKRAIFSGFSEAQAAADFILEPPQPVGLAMLSSGARRVGFDQEPLPQMLGESGCLFIG